MPILVYTSLFPYIHSITTATTTANPTIFQPTKQFITTTKQFLKYHRKTTTNIIPNSSKISSQTSHENYINQPQNIVTKQPRKSCKTASNIGTKQPGICFVYNIFIHFILPNSRTTTCQQHQQQYQQLVCIIT